MAENKNTFDAELVTKYPKSNKKIALSVRQYGLDPEGNYDEETITTHISPHGIEFQVPKEYPEGTLLKINISIPNFWSRKQKFVEYSRIDSPDSMRILAKVIKVEDVGKRGKKKKILVQTLNIDSVDEVVLKSYLQEAK